jgi:biotin carboxylase
VIALDEYDTQTAAALREHLRGRGMGETTARFFRDKLAMRARAREVGLPVPEFVAVLNYDDLRAYMRDVPPPWVLKPRTEASAMGIRKIEEPEQLWRALDALGDRQSHFLLERFVPGRVFHVDSAVVDREVVFAAANAYMEPPMRVYQGGGVFATRTMGYDAPDTQALLDLNRRLLRDFGFVRGVTHAEFICSDADGEFYFLEVAARVGGANIDRMVEAATNVNLWDAWARIEVSYLRGERCRLPEARRDYAGLVVCLSQQQHPDLSPYDAPEVAWRLDKEHHAGLIVASPDVGRVADLMDAYARRFEHDFLASQPPLEQAPE